MKISKVNTYGKWINKVSFAQPFSDKQEKELSEKGVFSVPDSADTYPKGGKGGRKGSYGYKDILQETGIVDLFKTDDPRLRKLYIPKSKNIVLIDGKEYFLAQIEKSKDYKKTNEHVDGKIIVFGPVVRGENGEINWKEIAPKPVALSYDKYSEQIQRSPKVIKERIDNVNSEIERYNKFVDRIMASEEKGKMGTVTILPLQIAYAEESIKNRLLQLKEQKKEMEKGKTKKEEQSQAVMQTYEQMGQEVSQGKEISPQDYAILLLEQKFHSVNTLEELRNKIGSEKMPFDEQTNTVLKDFILKIVDWQIQERKNETDKKTQEGIERTDRIEEEDLPEMKQLMMEKIAPITQLPGQYQKAEGYYSPMGFLSSESEATETIDRDYSELNAILSALERTRSEIISLPSKSGEYLRGEGSYAVQQIEELLKNIEAFIKRYKENPFVETPEGLSINPRLFGRQGQLGNGLLSVVLRQILMSIKSEIDRIKAGQPPAQEKIEQIKERKEPKEEKEPVKSKNKNEIQKMSEFLWRAFVKRGMPK